MYAIVQLEFAAFVRSAQASFLLVRALVFSRRNSSKECLAARTIGYMVVYEYSGKGSTVRQVHDDRSASRTPLGEAVNLSTKIAIQTSLEKAARRQK